MNKLVGQKEHAASAFLVGTFAVPWTLSVSLGGIILVITTWEYNFGRQPLVRFS